MPCHSLNFPFRVFSFSADAHPVPIASLGFACFGFEPFRAMPIGFRAACIRLRLASRPFRHLPLKRPGTPYIKIFANPVKSLLTAFPCPESCNFVLKSCNFVLIFSSLNGKVCSFPDGRTHLKGTLIYYFFDEPIATDCRPPPPACPVKLTCLLPLNPARPALPRLSLPPCLVLSACLLLHIHASSRVALLVMPCPAIPLASSLFYSWIA